MGYFPLQITIPLLQSLTIPLNNTIKYIQASVACRGKLSDNKSLYYDVYRHTATPGSVTYCSKCIVHHRLYNKDGNVHSDDRLLSIPVYFIFFFLPLDSVSPSPHTHWYKPIYTKHSQGCKHMDCARSLFHRILGIIISIIQSMQVCMYLPQSFLL